MEMTVYLLPYPPPFCQYRLSLASKQQVTL